MRALGLIMETNEPDTSLRQNEKNTEEFLPPVIPSPAFLSSSQSEPKSDRPDPTDLSREKYGKEKNYVITVFKAKMGKFPYFLSIFSYIFWAHFAIWESSRNFKLLYLI
jgi:hypothetical protein